MDKDRPIKWLLEGDVSVQYQTHRDLLGVEKRSLRDRISKEGWGKAFLESRRENGHWGRGFYQVKWISTHYTLLDLKHLGISPTNKECRGTIAMILNQNKSPDGGLNPHTEIADSDVCINGMGLNYACYFGANENALRSIVDFILSQQLDDGGFNCRLNRSGAVHSSLHTTISVLEGILEYKNNGYIYRLADLTKAESASREFVLQHKLFRSHRTGEIIDKKMLMLSYPSRWKYDILRALDYFQSAGVEYDHRMDDAMQVLLKKRRKDGAWPVQAKHPGQVHFDMEKTGSPSRWNTLRALRVLKHFEKTEY
ncbi:MAG TPA: prenyltransferase/squalene oxidase repeat-containing protein [Anaerolineales bacterium]|nr:prenyltransferase/squalene oxidase repeat-containing protein [Anaerolineales bacterium]